MGNCPLCNLESAVGPGGGVAPSGGFVVRAWRKISWVFPAGFLVLMPKCPLCVAMYVAMFSGVGISVSTARWLQGVMVGLCLVSMGYLALKWRRRSPGHGWGMGRGI